MATRRTTETFFRPDEVERETWTLSADTYNRCQLLLSRSETGCAFVPIRSLQFMGVIDADEIIFVDSQGYTVKEDAGGRPILVAWHPAKPQVRGSLTDVVPCQVLYYRPGLRNLQRQLIGDFAKALKELEQKYRDATIPACGAQIVPLKPAG
jgi:hypothetical protein